MNWTYTKLVGLLMLFAILSGFSFSVGFVSMGFAFIVCSVIMFLVIMTCYLGNHIPTK